MNLRFRKLDETDINDLHQFYETVDDEHVKDFKKYLEELKSLSFKES